MVMLVPETDISGLTLEPTINPSFGMSGIDPNLEAFFMPGFSNVPLVVDVSGTPIDTGFPVSIAPSLSADCGGLCSPRPAEVVFQQTKEAEIQRMEGIDFTSIGGIDFPTARPTDPLGQLIAGGLGLASQFIAEQVPATIPRAGTLSVNATACPVSYTPGGKLVHTHLRKQQVKARKSPVTQCVTNRHMNSLNPHALRRATRRLKGFMGHVHSAQKAIRHALGGSLGPKHRGTRARGGCMSCGAKSARSCVC